MTGDPIVGPYVSYKDVAYAAFGRPGQVAVIIGVLGHQMCIASGWVIVIANIANTLLPDFPRVAIVCWFFPILLMLAMIRYVKHLVPFSFFGCMVYAFGIIGVTYVFSFLDVHKDEWAQRMEPWDWKKSPLFMSTYTYAIEGIIGVLPNEASLKKPSQTNGVIAFSLFFYGINALVFALIAYLAGYGNGDTIIVSLPQDSYVIYVVKVCLIFALVMTHPLGINYASEPLEQIFLPQPLTATRTHPTDLLSSSSSATASPIGSPSSDPLKADGVSDKEGESRPLLWSGTSMGTIANDCVSSPPTAPMSINDGNGTFAATGAAAVQQQQQQQQQPAQKTWWQRRGLIVIRTTLVVITCVVAQFVPNFSTFSNFVGSFFLSFIGFVAPPAMYLKLRLNDRRWYDYAVAVPLIVYGFVFLVIGTYSAVNHVINPE